jgi:hypothetical protein
MGLQWLTRAAAMDDPEKSRVVGKIDWAVPPGGHSRISISGYGISKFSSLDKDKLFQILAIGSSAEAQLEAASLSMPLRRSVLNDPKIKEENRHCRSRSPSTVPRTSRTGRSRPRAPSASCCRSRCSCCWCSATWCAA